MFEYVLCETVPFPFVVRKEPGLGLKYLFYHLEVGVFLSLGCGCVVCMCVYICVFVCVCACVCTRSCMCDCQTDRQRQRQRQRQRDREKIAMFCVKCFVIFLLWDSIAVLLPQLKPDELGWKKLPSDVIRCLGSGATSTVLNFLMKGQPDLERVKILKLYHREDGCKERERAIFELPGPRDEEGPLPWLQVLERPKENCVVLSPCGERLENHTCTARM